MPTTNSLAAVMTAAGSALVLLVVLSAPGWAGTTKSTEVPSTEFGVEVHIVLSGDCAPENGAEVTVANHLTEPVEVHVAGIVAGSVVGGSSQRFAVNLFGTVEIKVGGAPIAFDEDAVCSSENASPAGPNPAPAEASAATTPAPVTAAPSFAG